MMSLLNRYVVRQLTTATLYALVALLALYFFFDVMAQIGDVGQGTFVRILGLPQPEQLVEIVREATGSGR